MIIQDSLIRRVELYVESLKKQARNEHLFFKVTSSKTTNSFYIKVYTYLDDEKISASYRVSDHLNSKITTKLVAKHTKFSTITNNIDKLIEKVNKIRTKKILENVSKESKSV